MEKIYVIGIIALLAIVGVVFAVTMSGGLSTNNTMLYALNENQKDQVLLENQKIKEITMQSFTQITDGKYYPQFSVKEITVQKGDLVRIRITNTNGAHDFKIDEFNVYSQTPLNKEVIIEFTADKEGEFTYYCSKPGHKQNGQWGTLTVI